MLRDERVNVGAQQKPTCQETSHQVDAMGSIAGDLWNGETRANVLSQCLVNLDQVGVACCL